MAILTVLLCGNLVACQPGQVELPTDNGIITSGNPLESASPMPEDREDPFLAANDSQAVLDIID